MPEGLTGVEASGDGSVCGSCVVRVEAAEEVGGYSSEVDLEEEGTELEVCCLVFVAEASVAVDEYSSEVDL